MMSERQAYFRGEWIPESQLAIPVGDLGFTMGITVTERLRTFGGELFCEQEHLTRMRSSLVIIGLPAKKIVAEVEQAIREYFVRHSSQMEPGDDWGIVAFATPGNGMPSGAGPTVCVHGAPLPFSDWADAYSCGVQTHLSTHRQIPPDCWPADLKCRSRMHYYLADREAREQNPESRALLLDHEGFLAEASTANLVVFDSNEGLKTPCFDKVLLGVSVALITELAEEMRMPFREADITPQELYDADEAWLTSTSSCLLPIVRCDSHPIGSGKPGLEFARFLAAWGRMVGVDIAGQARRFAIR